MQTLREVAGGGRLIVVFQPYRVYRTRDLEAEMAAVAGDRRRGDHDGGLRPRRGARNPGKGRISWRPSIFLRSARCSCPNWEDVAGEVVPRARPGDVVVTMGAPPISLMGDELLSALATGGGPSGQEHSMPGPNYIARHARPDSVSKA